MNETITESRRPGSEIARFAAFVVLAMILIIFAVMRSSVTTSQDSFTFDEAYHVGAGAAYVQTGDFRLNPEHPPLTKLWVGAYVSYLGYEMSPFRAFADKGDERDFVEQDAYFKNEPDLLQERTRTAMFALNGLLLLLFGIAVWRVFGATVGLAALAYLVIDPTVAAHLPVMMTDLPVALTSAAAVLFGAQAFRTWRAVDLVLASAALGLALSSKHSAVITMTAIAVIGFAAAIFFAKGAVWTTRLKRAGVVVCVLAGAVVVLWAFYMFRYTESPVTPDETFNRPLATKIGDINSPIYRAGLNVMSAGHLFPRSYIWGLADTIRAGAEGRAIPILAFGELYYSKGPFYYFPGVIAAKLPVGLILLTLAGLALFLIRKMPGEFDWPILGFAAFCLIFLLFLMKGSSYGGVRHALPLIPLLAVLAGFVMHYALRSRSYAVGGFAAAALILAMASAVPVMRPWEYFNEFAGGPENAYLYFSDEGVDLGLRVEDIAEYYDASLKPNGEVPFLAYFSSSVERRRRGLDWVGKDLERDAPRLAADTMEGTFIIGAPELTPKPWWDVAKPLREHVPAARFGNVFVFRGKFERPGAAIARGLYYRAVYSKLYVNEPDVPAGIEMLRQSIDLDPKAFFVALELGNQYLKLGDRGEAILAYEKSLEYAPATDNISERLREQIEALRAGTAGDISPLRNPGLE